MNCFDAGATSTWHTDGTWVSRTARPYSQRETAPAFSRLGIKLAPEANYFRCDRKAGRPVFQWVPRGCALRLMERGDACSTFRGKQIVIVGDSTASQLFLSLTLQLGGTFGRNSRPISGIDEATSSGCNDTVRMNFVRNDFVLWSNSKGDVDTARRYNPSLKLHAFTNRASRDADLVLIGAGHHFPNIISKIKDAHGLRTAPETKAFYFRNLNHTLTSLLAARRRWGHAAASVVVVGQAVPVPACDRFVAPIGLSDALLSHESTSFYSYVGMQRFWADVLKQNTMGRWVRHVAAP